MKIITFPEGQGSEEWKKWRSQGIGASDIAIILGSNSYSTPLKLWELKCGYRQEERINSAMAHGIQNEDIARQWVNEHFQLNLKPICIEDGDNPIFRASLDGYDFNQQTLVEIKCPISESVLDKARLSQFIPDYWFDQMQWQIMISQPKRAILAIWDYRVQSCITVEMFGISSKIEKMREEAKQFWHSVQIGKQPETQSSDFIEIEDPLLHQYLLEYQSLIEKEKTYSKRKKELRSLITDFGDDGNFMAYGFKIKRIAPPVKYDIEQMRVDGMDVDKYVRKSDSIGSYRIYPPKTNNKK